MTSFYRTALLCALSLPFGLGGCAVAVIGGMAAAGGAGYEAAQERGVAGSFHDVETKTELQSALLDANPALPTLLTVTVYDHRVLLTGRVPNPEMKAQARQIASARPGVRAVYDEIEVGPGPNGIAEAQDAWITARLRSELVLDANIRSGNFTIDTADGSVYLIGTARSQGEIERATQIARYVPGVKRVVSYMDIRSGVPVADQTVPSSVTTGGYVPQEAPAARIERQKL